MSEPDQLLIFGASARAAAFSALRAGLRPWCADLFADTDLAACCPVVRISADDYPHAFLDLLAAAPRGPWLYTGGLENRPTLVGKMARLAPLWGNGRRTLAHVRDPFFVASLLEKQGLPTLRPGRLEDGEPGEGRWLLKPRAGAGGAGIRFWQPGGPLPRTPSAFYFQPWIEGEALAAVFVAAAGEAWLLGVTRQLVGVPWLHAPDFAYCGSVTFQRPADVASTIQQLGQVLATGCELVGLFGIDLVLKNGVPYLIEVNPRYTASVEVVEHATGVAALGSHRAAFSLGAGAVLGAGLLTPPGTALGAGLLTPPGTALGAGLLTPPRGGSVGKAILFAAATLAFPGRGPWSEAPVDAGLPAFADVPPPGEVISAGRPICTLLARGNDPAECLAALRLRADTLARVLEAKPVRGVENRG